MVKHLLVLAALALAVLGTGASARLITAFHHDWASGLDPASIDLSGAGACDPSCSVDPEPVDGNDDLRDCELTQQARGFHNAGGVCNTNGYCFNFVVDLRPTRSYRVGRAWHHDPDDEDYHWTLSLHNPQCCDVPFCNPLDQDEGLFLQYVRYWYDIGLPSNNGVWIKVASIHAEAPIVSGVWDDQFSAHGVSQVFSGTTYMSGSAMSQHWFRFASTPLDDDDKVWINSMSLEVPVVDGPSSEDEALIAQYLPVGNHAVYAAMLDEGMDEAWPLTTPVNDAYAYHADAVEACTKALYIGAVIRPSVRTRPFILHDLEPHDRLDIRFDAYALRAWSGQQFALLIDGTEVYRTSFSTNPSFNQCYPGAAPCDPQDEVSAFTGASFRNDNCTQGSSLVASFPVQISVPHSASSVTVVFDKPENELVATRFGVRNLLVSVHPTDTKPDPTLLYVILGITGGAILVAGVLGLLLTSRRWLGPSDLDNVSQTATLGDKTSVGAGTKAGGASTRRPSAQQRKRTASASGKKRKPQRPEPAATEKKRSSLTSIATTATSASALSMYGTGDDFGHSDERMALAARSNSTPGIRRVVRKT